MQQIFPLKNNSTIYCVGKDMNFVLFDYRKHHHFTYISDLPDFSQDFIASDLLLDAIFATVNSM